MTVLVRFSRRSTAPVRDLRRPRATERWTFLLAVAGVVLERLAAADVLPLLPASWRPYVIGAAAASAAWGAMEYIDRRRDYRRFLYNAHVGDARLNGLSRREDT